MRMEMRTWNVLFQEHELMFEGPIPQDTGETFLLESLSRTTNQENSALQQFPNNNCWSSPSCKATKHDCPRE